MKTRDNFRNPWELTGGVDFVEFAAGSLRIWDDPVEGKEYIIGADVAEGKIRDIGQTGRVPIKKGRDNPDCSAAVVIEVEYGQHVATWVADDVIPSHYAAILAALATHYNHAMIIPEINGPGVSVVENLVNVIRYPSLYREKFWNRAEIDDPGGPQLGWRTTKQNRPFLINRIHEWLHSAPLTRDAELVAELRKMQVDSQGVPRAMNKDKDDRVLALGLALQGRYERLNGHVGARNTADPYAQLPPHDQAVWRKVHEQEQKRDRNNRSPRRIKPLPRIR